GFEDLARPVEVRVGVIAVAHLLDGQVEDVGVEAQALGAQHGTPVRGRGTKSSSFDKLRMTHMATRTNGEIAKDLREIRTLMEFAGEPFFKFMAYERAAETLENAPPLGGGVDAARLTE